VRSQPLPTPPTFLELENIGFQAMRLEFDEKRAQSDSERAERALLVSTLATLIPLALGVIAIVVGVINQYRQAKHQFDLKAAEIIFSGTTPQTILSRGKALKKVFSKRLSKDFLADLKVEDIGGYTEPVDAKLAFLDKIVEKPEKKAEIIQTWFLVFPGDFRWLVRFAPEQFRDTDLPEIQDLLAKLGAEKNKQLVKETSGLSGEPASRPRN
jgi:hypothetical protein